MVGSIFFLTQLFLTNTTEQGQREMARTTLRAEEWKKELKGRLLKQERKKKAAKQQSFPV